MSANSTRKPRSRKDAANRPKKPYPAFPLGAHASGKWQKRIRGKIHYFGRWARMVNGQMVRIEGDGWKEALELFKAQCDDLFAGRKPRPKTDELTVADLCNQFRSAKLRKLESKELSGRMYQEYVMTCDRLVKTFGGQRPVADLASDDFAKLRHEFAKQYGPVRLCNEVQKVRSVFKYALLAHKVIVNYGPEFTKPSKAVLRIHKKSRGSKMLEAEELRNLLEAADPQMKAMLLVGLNCAFGNHDIATLPVSAIDLERGWIDYARPKTGIDRLCPLWPETVEALKEVIANRAEPKEETAKGLVFINSRGYPFVRTTAKSRTDTVGPQFTSLLEDAGLYREGLGFYSLRHIHRTKADGARDSVAIDIIMGHVDPSMGANYRHFVEMVRAHDVNEEARLLSVVNHVHDWLFPKKGPGQDVAPATIPMRARALA